MVGVGYCTDYRDSVGYITCKTEKAILAMYGMSLLTEWLILTSFRWRLLNWAVHVPWNTLVHMHLQEKGKRHSRHKNIPYLTMNLHILHELPVTIATDRHLNKLIL